MAKSGQTPKKENTPAQKAAPASRAAVAPVINRLAMAPIGSSMDPVLQKVFWGLAAIGLIVLIAFSFGSGINADDKFQVDYSQKLVNYYGTFGKDTSAYYIKDGNMHLYGGFFEVATGFTNKALGNTPDQIAYHHVRHVYSALFGWIAILCAALLARYLGGNKAGIIALGILFVSPRFMGDSLMNPKDIPFAAGYIMALYNMAVLFDGLPQVRRWNLIGLILGLGIGLATRAGGLLTFAIVGLFAGLHLFFRYGGLKALGNAAFKKYAGVTALALVAGYALALLFWPFALKSPLSNPFVALAKFADLEVNIRVLYEGQNMMSNVTPWHYPLKWILYTIPLVALLGFAGSLLYIPFALVQLFGKPSAEQAKAPIFRRYNPLWVGMVLFAAIFPVAYVIYKDSVIHDGWRHLTFSYPPLVVAAALFWAEMTELLRRKNAAAQYAIAGLLVLLAASPAWFILANRQYPYVYFNELTGGVKGAYGKFETDYWGVSVRQGIEYLEQQGILNNNMQEPIIIATNMYYSAKQLTAKYGDKVKIKYLKWEKRCDDAWDYALYPTRYLDGQTLQKGMWPPDNAIHVVEAAGVPLLAVLKDNGKNCALGQAAVKVGDWNTAIERLKAEVANVPDNDLAWATLAQAYYSNQQAEESKAAAEKALQISPDDSQANNLIGLYWLEKNDVGKARMQFEKAVAAEPSNAVALYYLGNISFSQNNASAALKYLYKAIETAPNFKPAYELSAKIYESMGDMQRAQQFRAAMPR